jgi:hypothetical protein
MLAQEPVYAQRDTEREESHTQQKFVPQKEHEAERQEFAHWFLLQVRRWFSASLCQWRPRAACALGTSAGVARETPDPRNLLRGFPDSRYWFARFIGPTGKQETRSTKEVDKGRAQKIADRFELAAHMARVGGLAARRARKVIGEIYEISNREPLPSDTVADNFHRWTSSLPVSHGHKTAVRYGGIVKAF